MTTPAPHTMALLIALGLASTACGDGESNAHDANGIDGDYCSPTVGWPSDSAALEKEILTLVNQHRAQGAQCGDEAIGPREPLEMHPALQCAARVHTADMVEHDYFSHTGRNGSSPGDRMKAAGYEGGGWGENIASGSSTAEGAMDQWMNSPGHCRNIMGNYRYIGVGYAGDGERHHLWTQTFGG